MASAWTTRSSGESAKCAGKRPERSRRGTELVVCIGGDGMVLQVATALAGSGIPLGIVPTGTGNLLAGNLKLPHGREDAVRTALTGRRRRIDLGRITVGGKRRDFTVACGVGFDADVMEGTDPTQKGRWGKIAYLASAIRETGNIRNGPHTITLDGVRTETDAAQVLVANFGRVPPGIKVRGVRADDGILDVFVIRADGPLPALLAGWKPSARRVRARGRRPVLRARARKIRIDTDPARRVSRWTAASSGPRR